MSMLSLSSRNMVLAALVVGLGVGIFFVMSLTQRVATRRYEQERQDLSMAEGRYTVEEYQDMMRILTEINHADWTGGYKASLAHFEKLQQVDGPIKTILEIGFGRGDFSILLAKKFPNATVLGIDTHNLSVQAANENLRKLGNAAPKNVRFELRAAVELSEPKNSFDVITTNLVNHHIFPNEAFVEFLRRVRLSGHKAFIFNDLYRTPVCYIKTVAFVEMIRLCGGKPFIKILQMFRLLVLKTSKLIPSLTSFWNLLLKDIDMALRNLEIFREDRPGESLALDGGIASVERAFSFDELRVLLAEAGFAEESALECSYSGVAPSVELCRMACLLDLK